MGNQTHTIVIHMTHDKLHCESDCSCIHCMHYRPMCSYTSIIHGSSDDRYTMYYTCRYTSRIHESTLCKDYLTLTNFNYITTMVLVVSNNIYIYIYIYISYIYYFYILYISIIALASIHSLLTNIDGHSGLGSTEFRSNTMVKNMNTR